MITCDLSAHPGEKKYYALYQRVKEDILCGAVKPGAKLPSKRALAEHMGVSVITVENAYRQLSDEGYIQPRERSGYFVRDIQGFSLQSAAPHAPLVLLPEEPPDAPPDMLFPYSLWFKTLRDVMSRYGERLVARSPNKGCTALRNAIASYLLRYRGMYAPPQRIIVGSGSEQLYEAIARTLGSDRVYAIEYPSYHQIEAVYTGAGARVDRLAIGADGIESGCLRRTAAEVLHVTPFHSYPTGVTAPAGKRYEYLQWAERAERYIVEDDFDSEFFMPGKPLESLYSLDKRGRVIYVNTFSKSLAPSMRMGYMILPEALMPLYDKRMGMYSCSVPLLEQYALAEFLDKGYFERHLSRKRRRRREPSESG